MEFYQDCQQQRAGYVPGIGLAVYPGLRNGRLDVQESGPGRSGVITGPEWPFIPGSLGGILKGWLL